MGYDLSVIVARTGAAERLEPCLMALDRSCAGLAIEVLVAERMGLPACGWRGESLAVRTLRIAGEPLVPQLWAAGATAASGTVVAFTLAACQVSNEWAGAVTEALRAGATGVAGPLERGPDLGWVDTAVYYLRYSAFLPSRVGDADVGGEIPGDNAAYRREALHRHRDVIGEGFWEVLFHRAVRQEGGRLCTRRLASAQFTGGVSLLETLRYRFAHGRHFGAWRVAERQRATWQILAAAPLVPALLAARAGLRVATSPADRWPFARSLPIFLVIAAAWAAGEATGALRGAGLPKVSAVEELSHEGGKTPTPVVTR